MIINYTAKCDKMGRVYQLQIDTSARTFKQGYFIFSTCFTSDYTRTTKSAIKEIGATLEKQGYKRVND